MAESIIAVIGARGGTGRPVVGALRKNGARVRAISRNVDVAGVFPVDVEICPADLKDSQSLIAAFRGVTSIHYIPPSFDPGELEFARNIIMAAECAGVSRIVYHSVLHPGTPEMPHHLRKSHVEHQLRHSELVWTIMQPAMYAQTVLAFFDASAGELIPAFDPAKPFTPVHEGDLAEAAAIIHSSDSHAYATYELAGSEVMTFITMSEKLGQVLGRTISTRKVDAEKLAKHVAELRGYTPEQVRELLLMFDHYDGFGLVGNGNVLRMLLGREPTSFGEAMRQSLVPAQETAR